MRSIHRVMSVAGAVVALSVPIGMSGSASAATSAPSPRTCTYGPSYDTWSQHATGVTITFYSIPTWYPVPKQNVYAKAVRYRFDNRSRWVAHAGQIKVGTAWKSVPLDNTYRYVGSVASGTSFGTSGGWFTDNAQHNLDWYGKVC